MSARVGLETSLARLWAFDRDRPLGGPGGNCPRNPYVPEADG